MNALIEKIILLALLIPFQLQAATNFVEKGSSDWNMLHIIDGVDPASADSDFNSTWYHPTSGGYIGGAYDGPAFTGGLPSPFHFGTVNGLSGGTALATPPSGSRYTSYFYKVIDAGSGAENIKISLLADDGAFVYLNGQLVARYNVTDPDTYTKFTSANGNESDYSDLAILGDATLQPGLNLLAISVHQTSATSSDLGFDLELVGDFGLPLTNADSSDWAVLNTVDPANNGYDPVTGHSSQAGDADFNDTWKNQTFGGYTGVAYDGPGFTTGQQAPFSYGGVDGIPSPNTVLTAPNSGTRHTEYFIKEIDGGATGFDKATFTVLADDGAFLYLNGNLVGVVGNLPNDAGQDTWSRFAGSVGSETTFHTLTVTGTGIIQPGANLLAVSMHQHSATSSDLGFSLKLIGEEIGAPTIVRGPYLQSGSHDRMTLRWRTSEASNSVVHYGDSPTNLTESMTLNDSVTDHIVPLTGLTAATQYYYQIESTNSSGNISQGAETDYYFKTSPAPGARVPTRIWVIGDAGTRTSDQTNVYNAYRTRTGTAHTDSWLMLGDNAYNSGTDSEFQGALFDAYPELLRNTTMWSCIGNHETYTNGGSPYLDLHSFPTAGECGGVPSGSEHYYSYDHGNIHFVCLDSATSNVSDTPGSGGMIDWLEMDLQATDKDWIIAYFHHGPYTKGSHDSDTESRHIEARRYMTPLLESYGVDLVLSGHSHTYERSMLVNGHHSNMSVDDSSSGTFDSNSHVIDGGNGSGLGSIDGNGNFITNGGDGAYLKDLGSVQSGTIYSVCGASGKISNWDNGSSLTVNPAPHPVFVVNLRTLGSMIINVDGNTLNAQYLDDNNVVRDDFTIEKQGPVVANLPPVLGDAGFAIAENASVGTFVGIVTGTDPNTGDVLAYSITGGNTGGAFSINSSTGEITTVTALDFETTPSYTLTVTVTDDGSPILSDTASVTITLLDVNEAPSLADSAGGTGEVDQPYSGSIGGTGSDPDANDTLTYGKVSGPTWLAIAPDGTLSGTPTNLNDGTNVWAVRVTDSGGLIANATLEITITANKPPLANDALFSVPENSSIGTVVGAVTATDPDAGDSLSFAITGGNPAGAFTIDAMTGQLTSAGMLDFEDTSSFALTVTVTDDGSPALSDTASVTVTLLDVNEAPSLADSTGGDGESGQPYSGSIGGTGSDPDADDTLTYSKISGPTWLTIDDNGTFSGTPANEDVGTQSWGIRVTDSDGETADATLQITITANSPPSASDAVFSVPENSSIGTVVGTVIATDPGDSLSFAITGGNSTGAFTLNVDTGEITTTAALDFETTPSDTLTITVTDDGTPPLNDAAVITINVTNLNEAPVANDTGGSVAEDGSIGTAVATVVATDVDAGDTLSYAITGGNTGGAFAIDSNGNITTAAALDFETTPSYPLTVTVTDDGTPQESDTATITIDVSNVNEAPSLSDITGGDGEVDQPYSGSIGGTGSDPDAGDTLTYSLGGGATWLTIDPDGTLSGTPTSEEIGINTWPVLVMDSGGETAEATLQITVADAPSGPISVSASGETTNTGTISSGDLASATNSDNSYETLTEEVSGGKRNKQRSQLDHQWTFSNVPSGSSATLRVEAHHTVNSEGDDFVFSYSTDGTTFIDVLTVTKTSDDNVEQTALLPSNISGTVFVKVTDTDQSQGNSFADSLFVDLLAIDVTSLSGPPLAAGNPSPADAAIGTTLNPILTWTAGGGADSYQVYFGTETFPETDYGNQTDLSFDPGTLVPSQQYFWRIDSISNSNGTTTGTVWSFTTGSGASSNLFSDDFENGNLDDWATTGNVSAHSNAANSGVYGARFRGAAEMIVTVNTTGFTSVNLKYDRSTSQFEANETLDVHWSLDGSNWNLIESTNATSWGATIDKTLLAPAAGQPALQIRFKTNASSRKEYGYLDNVIITGS